MLIEFSVKNFKSIKERQTLSMVASKGGELRNTNIIQALDNKLDLVRTAVIYGPNASGKTNLVKALQTMRKIVLNQGQRGDVLKITPYLFDKETQLLPSEFSVTFVIQNVRYEYGFIATNEQVLEEWLLAYPKGNQAWIDRKFNKDSQQYEWGNMDKLTGTKQVWQEATRPNALFLSTAILLNNTQLQPVFDWFRLYVRAIPGDLAPNFTLELCEDNNLKLEILKFLQAADFHIIDLELKSELVQLEDLSPASQKELAKIIKSNSNDKLEIQKYDVKTIHMGKEGDKYLLDMGDESSGTQKFFASAGPWLDVLKNGYLLVIDELNNNLHPELVKFMVEMFHDNALNRKNAQLIFTTHEISILHQEIFRRDQIWFTEKDEFNATTLYPLSDFSPRKGVENLEKNYLQGRYGALPYLQNVANLFEGQA